jgi:ABC-type enterochelin transport system substrate-binding protein
LLLSTITSFAGEIREFDLKTIERLGNELIIISTLRATRADPMLALAHNA